jgi:hypothetical protein
MYGLTAPTAQQAVHNLDINWSIRALQDNKFSVTIPRYSVLEVLVISLLLQPIPIFSHEKYVKYFFIM